MSRASSRLSQRYQRPNSRIRRPKSAAPCLFSPEPEVIFEDEDHLGPLRPHTSFHYYPEELDGVDVGVGVGVDVGVDDPQLTERDYSQDPDFQAWSQPEDPDPLKLVKKYGYGYRKREKELTPHWSQWPQPPAAEKPQYKPRSPPHTVTVQPAYVCKKRQPVQPTVYDPVIQHNPYHTKMACRRNYSDERNIIMHRGLSPRRAAPPVMPGRSMTQYGSFGNRDYIGSLDLSVPPQYNAYRGYNVPTSSRAMSRESRPMHRHLRNARQDEGYLHNNSIYYSTTPNVSGYFIIHPDWVSERLSMRRSQSLLAF